jgi:hypothetical protein
MLQMTSHPLGHSFETMMGKRQEQNPDEGFLMIKMPMYFLVTVDKVNNCVMVEDTTPHTHYSLHIPSR